MLLNIRYEYHFSKAGNDDTKSIYYCPNHIHGGKVTSQKFMLFPIETTLCQHDRVEGTVNQVIYNKIIFVFIKVLSSKVLCWIKF
jgi:hypothetical protein